MGLESAYTYRKVMHCVIGVMPVIMCKCRMMLQKDEPKDYVIATGDNLLCVILFVVSWWLGIELDLKEKDYKRLGSYRV